MHRRIIAVPVVLSILCLLTGCIALNDARTRMAETNAVFEVEYDGQVIRDLRYGDSPRNLYDLYLPENTGDAKASHLILFIHGGSWTGGDKIDGELYCRNFASHGYVAASISYTLKTDATDTNILLVNDEVKAAVSAIKSECDELGIPLSDMAVSGFSAGACQAMMYGFKEASTSVLPVRFIIQMSGPTTFEPSVWRGKGEVHWIVGRQTGLDGTDKGDAAWISLFSGENVTEEMVRSGEAEAVWKKISPYTYVTDSSVPVLSLFGALDGVVPPSSRLILEKALDDNGVRHDTFLMENSGHALACDVEVACMFLAKIYEYCGEFFL